ncbi:Uncharacterised protein [uncultured Blautia sp.]|nr:Uncharacterised protein [uncultured Blautia sp.]
MNNFKFVELRKIMIADTYMDFLTLFTNMLHGSNQRLVVESKMCITKTNTKGFLTRRSKR